jgi:hypothetical protein
MYSPHFLKSKKERVRGGGGKGVTPHQLKGL